jgi:uncharacterized protein with ParB-like and HNH nuclease domain
MTSTDSDLFGNEIENSSPLDQVIDEAEKEQQPHKRFQITSYGADMTVFELTHRLGKDLIIPPAFQRKYVWSKRQASRFVESLLMGLPVPWPAPGSEDTKFGVTMEPEVGHGEAEVHAGVQA